MADDDTSIALAKLTFLESAREKENDLLAERSTWLVLAQSFLFGTFALVNDQITRQPPPAVVARMLFRLIPIVGLSLAVLVLLAVGAAIFMLWFWHFQLVVLIESPEVAKLRWPAPRRRLVMALGQLPSLVAPLGLAIIWTILLTSSPPPPAGR